MFQSEGTLHYSENPYKLILEVDSDLARYYRWLLPKAYPRQPPRYRPHCTVVRSYIETPVNLNVWHKYENHVITFQYSSYIHEDGPYYKLEVFAPHLNDIREELGLPRHRQKQDGSEWEFFHITIANRKGL